jgi:urease subunit gamma/beta
VRLLPREQDRLLVFLAAELARRRRGRGLRLSQAEAVALICDETMEAARDGLAYAEVVQRGYAVLGPDDVADGVAELVGRIELEALFADGSRLVVLESPVLRDAPPAPRDVRDAPPWEGATAALAVTNEGDVPVGLTSHFHVFEANRSLRFDRRAAWGMRLALPPGEKVVVEPGATLELQLRPIAGARVVRGHAGLVDGPLDEPGALEAALALARARGYRGA